MNRRPLLLATIEGYSTEGGYDRPHEPTSIYSPTISLARHAGPGEAASLWSDYEVVLDMVSELGLDGICLTPEWTRIEPRRGQVSGEAIARYREVFDYAQQRGLHVTVCVVGHVWPAWLGMEAWLLPWVAPELARHARLVASEFEGRFNSLIVFRDGESMIRRGFLEAAAPPWRKGAGDDALNAHEHILAVEHQLREDPHVGPKIVSSFANVEVDDVDQLRALLKSDEFEELHIASLIRGAGPTAAAAGLLSKRDGRWEISASAILRDVLLAR